MADNITPNSDETVGEKGSEANASFPPADDKQAKKNTDTHPRGDACDMENHVDKI